MPPKGQMGNYMLQLGLDHNTKRTLRTLCVIAVFGVGLSACSTVKTVGKATGAVAAFPFKAVYKTGELTTKGLYNTGKGVYHVATVPVKMTNAALDTGAKVLTVTTKVVDLSGKVIEVSRNIERAEVDAYVNKARGATNVLSVLVDAARLVTPS